ncbi:hypothetical protein BH11MYX1_BH11MYX1_54410 [soil metagenome]
MSARARRRTKLGLLLAVALGGCGDALDQRLAIVDRPRVLAIMAEPPEVTPGGSVTLSAVLAGPAGPLSASPAWSLCTAPKPPTEDNAVADGCLANAVTDLGTAASIIATTPSDACRTYGPDIASPGFRPRDPDASGGYYQPIRANSPTLELAFGFVRITCDLANASSDVAEQYKTMYVANANPSLTGIAIDNVPIDPTRATPTIAIADHDVTLRTGWPASAVESFLYFDPSAMQLVTRHEAMRVSWFATSGELAVDASAVTEDDPALTVSTTWRAPQVPGPAWIWLVLRDSRGGIATATFPITVEL